MSTKPTNPKDAIGSNKLPLHLWPATATVMGCIAMANGMLKYGRSNFRAIGVKSSIYYDAATRHITAWFEGEECDPDDGVPHLAAALACIAIIIDAKAAGKLDDDRMYKGGYHALVKELTPHVARLKELHKDKNPTHYTIEKSELIDTQEPIAWGIFDHEGVMRGVEDCRANANAYINEVLDTDGLSDEERANVGKWTMKPLYGPEEIAAAQ